MNEYKEKEKFLELVTMDCNKERLNSFLKVVKSNAKLNLKELLKYDLEKQPLDFISYYGFDLEDLHQKQFIINFVLVGDEFEMQLDGITKKDFHRIFKKINTNKMVKYLCDKCNKNYSQFKNGDVLKLDYKLNITLEIDNLIKECVYNKMLQEKPEKKIQVKRIKI